MRLVNVPATTFAKGSLYNFPPPATSRDAEADTPASARVPRDLKNDRRPCDRFCAGWLGASLRDPGALANAPGSRRLAPSHPQWSGHSSSFISLIDLRPGGGILHET